ncbi:adenylyl-sulfate kinase [Paenibacillus hamazuiensis]|uniref:adenylyl-sulfate kinase n=1 Tax=Paenibacillus hamazuiensis TaxID=2936508 RepID=UPI00200F1205|nr:adenylyl-sulfate kinase [Paenibacillus hamazuiensis]
MQHVNQGLTVWLTGLSGAGKTTTAVALAAAMRDRGSRVECLDGDSLREKIGRELGFGREDRMENVRRAVYISEMLNRHGVTAIVSMISPYREMRAYARAVLPHFLEVYVSCPVEVCEQRDVKGLYAKARRGEIAHFTGISDGYEPPECPDMVIRTDTETVAGNVQRILDAPALRRFLPPW